MVLVVLDLVVLEKKAWAVAVKAPPTLLPGDYDTKTVTTTIIEACPD